jgi:hypothetical protein
VKTLIIQLRAASVWGISEPDMRARITLGTRGLNRRGLRYWNKQGCRCGDASTRFTPF